VPKELQMIRAIQDKKVKMLMIPSPVGSGCETAEFV
jgi:hypothetical protein